MTTQHTPGPWTVTNSGLSIKSSGHSIHDRIADVYHSEKSAEIDRANARLIAAAPELLEALKGTLAMLELLNAPGTNDPIEARVFQARAAILKATNP